MALNIPSSPFSIEKFSTKTRFVTNYYPFTSSNVGNEIIYKYSISYFPLIPEASTVLKKKIIFNLKEPLTKIYQLHISFGNFLFSREKIIDSTSNSVQVDNVKYDVKISYLSEVQPYDSEHTHFMKILLNHLLTKVKFQRIGQKFYDPFKAKSLEGKPLKVWPGFSATVFGATTSSFVKLDLSSRIANTSSVLVFIQSLNMNGQSRNEYLMNELKGKTIYTFYNNKTYKIEGVDFSRSPKDTFKMKERVISFSEYYLETYQKKIQDMNQPILQSKGKKGELIELIPELCCMTGLDEEMRKDFQLMKEVARVSDKKPQIRIKECKELIDAINQNPNCILTLQAWKSQLNDKPLVAEGHVIKAGSLIMKNAISIENSRGLERDLQQEPKMTVKLSEWAIMYSKRCESSFKALIDSFKSIVTKFNLGFPMPKLFRVESDSPKEWEDQISKLNPDVKMLVCVIYGTKGRPNSYNQLKSYLLEKIPIPSQFILNSTIDKGKNLYSIVYKIAIQILAKIGGIPWEINEIPYLQRPIMFIGLTIVKKGEKSALCICASINIGISKYFSQSLIVPGKITTSPNFADQIHNAIEAFKRLAKIIPENIVIYREGVGGSQTRIIESIEVTSIENMLAINYKDQNLKFTFIVVNKKINTKFFLETNSDPQNPPPGSFLSKTIVSHNSQEFYLVSQRTIQGCANPVHYEIIKSTNTDPGFLEALPVISYKLCYLYYHVCGSIRFPAPLRYALLLGKLLSERKNEIVSPMPQFDQYNSLYFM